uniref:DNA-directed RNA polymerase subunit beta' n=1 Tax=Gemmiger formicilis TaxID=745368 RepID=UPI004024FF97
MENNVFDSIKIGLASPEQIRNWSYGEVKKPETINYRTLKPERDGLYCERIFGPTKDWECHCGKYKRIRYKGKICDRCGVEVTKAKVRRKRMGHIELAAPVSHIWYFKGIPSRIGLMLDISPRLLEKVLYFASYIVTDPGLTPLEKKQLLTEKEYREMRERYGDEFEASMGAEAIQELLKEIDLDQLSAELTAEVEKSSGQKKVRILKRLEVVEAFRISGNRPEWMVMDVLPVLPPDLRPMVQLDGGRFATSDLNDLYRRVLNRNNRLRRLLELGAPDIIVRNEKRMLQEAVDSLIDNGRRGRPVTGPNNRALKSLSDLLKGKQGRFRQNLLGKRVDYSGRSVIVVGPELKMDQCGLPKEMALELFKPFVMKDLVEKGVANNIKSARKMVERAKPEVWDSLETVIKGHPVLLNRAPTLHRLGIQAFNPVLVEGRAIKLHPLACTAFNADFDGDQMAVHLPLGEDACREAKMLMLASGNLLKPSDGAPVTVPTQDMILGSYYLTTVRENEEGAGKIFRDENEALMAYAEHVVTLHAPIKVRRTMVIDGVERTGLVDATVGRIIFNNPVPQNLGYIDRTDPEHWLEYEVSFRVTKKTLPDIISRCMTRNGTRACAKMLDSIKAQGYKYSTLSAISVAVCDAVIPPQKDELIADADKQVSQVNKLFNRGLISENERYTQTINIWQATTDKVSKALAANLPKDNEIFMMADSGARGSMNQIKQLAGMRGLLANTAGKTIEMPIRANYREGLNILEYFVSARGARKRLADTALRTADSGYLTRRLVDVSQEVIIREEDCHATEGIWVREISEGNSVVESFKERLNGRYSLHDVHDPATGELLVSKEKMMDMFDAEKIVNAGITELEIRSVMTCRAHVGVCAHCYGSNMSNGECVKVGESVGIIAAESIGEPGTQLTMRTFHTGGIASAEDITQGLPRVEELFESRRPKAMAIMSEIAGTVHIDDTKKSRHAEITGTDENGAPVTKSYLIPFGQRLKVMEGDEVAKGALLTEGHAYPQDILAIQGPIATQNYLISEVQKVYRLQGVDINDKHIEVIVRQMMRKVRIEDSGSSDFIMGSIVNRRDVMIKNEEIQARIDAGETDLKLVQASQVLLGITKSSLATDSFLSAASFQETTRVLTEAAIKGKVDPLAGLKENVIIGKLIPAGTGLPEVEEELVQAEIARDAAEAAYDH